MTRRRLVGLAVLVLALAAAAPAQADSIVLVLRGDVVRIDPERPRERVVVKRAQGSPWVTVSQSDDGSLVAQRERAFQLMSATGRPRGGLIDADPRKVAPSAFGPYDPEVSPNGRYLAWWNGFNFVVSLPTLTDAFGNLTDTLTNFTGPVLGEVFFPNSITTNTSPTRQLEGSIYGPWASWYGNEGIITGSPKRGAVDFDPLDGNPQPRAWFNDSDSANALAPRVTRRRDRMAVIQHSRFGAPEGKTAKDQIRIYELNGPPPSLPTAGCVIAATGGSFHEVSWSPDGKRLAWADPRGIWVAGAPRRSRGTNDQPCTLRPSPRLLVRGGAEPHWGPADLPRRSRRSR